MNYKVFVPITPGAAAATQYMIQYPPRLMTERLAPLSAARPKIVDCLNKRGYKELLPEGPNYPKK